MSARCVGIVCFAFAFALVACAPTSVRSAPSPIPGAPEVIVTATEMRFSPAALTLPSAQVNLTLRNDGTQPHDLTISALGVYLVAQPGQSVTAGLRDLPKGRYAPYCSLPGHADGGMRMTLTVE